MTLSNKPVNHRVYWGLFFIAMFVLAMAVRWHVIELDREVRREGLSSQVFVSTRTVLLDVLDIETGLRGYQIVGKSEFLRPYHEGLGRLDEDRARLRGLTATDPMERPHVEAADEGIGHVLDEFHTQVALAETDGIEAARARFLASPTKPMVDLIRDHLLAVQVEETRKILDATNTLNRQMSATLWLLDTFSLVAVLLLVAMLIGIVSDPVIAPGTARDES